MPKVGMEPVRRRALISAAIEAIHDRGMAGLTMGDIAKRAGVSSALAHHYFGSKDDLLIATMRHLLEALGEEFRRRLAEAATPQQRIEAIIEGNFAADQFQPAVISAWLAFYMQAQHDAEAMRLLKVYLRRLESNLLHALGELVPPEVARDTARGAAAMIDGLWLRAALRAIDVPAEEAVRLVRDYVSETVKRHA
ncbi:transcriptional regulator BetI [Chthonobacter rhizosphaerae]|uniref:transcriptional regulator BetI n=1 Tax=Chthonobacter rhizosphaerae TaxID=2735553 RepID=UPI0015EE75AC|nr:transcriptional regulator BetI [Chthonobacter rhizosphaerae]